MRNLRLVLASVLALAVLPACKKSPKPTLPPPPDCTSSAAGDNVVLPGATAFHRIFRCSGHANQVMTFYAPHLEALGAKKTGPTQFVHDNLVHTGGFGRDGTVEVKDATQPAAWLAIEETSDATYVDLWESVPKK